MLRVLPLSNFSSVAAFWRKTLTGRDWRACIAALTIVSFLALTVTASTHRHTTATEDQACSVCSVVSHKLGGVPPAAVVAQHVAFVLYRVATVEFSQPVYASRSLLPPSCGPPALA